MTAIGVGVLLLVFCAVCAMWFGVFFYPFKFGKGKKKRLLFYVAGPYSADEYLGEADKRARIERNIDAAEQVGIELAKLGCAPVIPHTNTRHPEFEKAQGYEFWIEVTLEMLKRCDALVTVPGWESSSGAHGEVQWAEEHGMPVFHDPEDAAQWEGRSTMRKTANIWLISSAIINTIFAVVRWGEEDAGWHIGAVVSCVVLLWLLSPWWETSSDKKGPATRKPSRYTNPGHPRK